MDLSKVQNLVTTEGVVFSGLLGLIQDIVSIVERGHFIINVHSYV